MTLRHISIFIAAVALVGGCKSADTAANTPDTSPATTTGSTATSTPENSTTPPATTADASGNSVVGTWTNNDADTPDTVVEFKPDGTLTMKGTSKEMKGVDLAGAATYKIDAGKITIKITDMKMTPTADADEKTKKAVEAETKMLTPEAIAKEPAETDTMVWKDKDTFTTTDPKGKAVTFTRKAG